MFLRILKKDLIRKKTMNIILFLFIVLATMFVASGINNVVTVMNGTDYYLDKAGVGDYIILTQGEGAVGALDEMLETEEAIKGYRLEQIVLGSLNYMTKADGGELDSNNLAIYQSVEGAAITFFYRENEPITEIEPGHMYATGNIMEKNNLQPGDVMRLDHNGVELEFVLDGMAKDALLGSDFMGNTRFLMSDADMQKLLANETISELYRGEICYIDTDDVTAIKIAMADVTNIGFDGTRSVIKLTYVMDMIVAFVVLILSVCLIIVSFVVLKFTITFTITEEFREIGVMKAIGLSNRKIRSLYIVKYLLMSVLGAAVGFFASIPFGKLLLNSVSKKMVLGNDNALMINLLGSVLVVCLILLFAYLCTGKVKKATPVDAIRSGQTGERYKNKTALRIQKCPTGNALFMAMNDVLSSPKRFLSIIISFGLCTLFVLLLVNTTATLKSDKLVYTFGTKSDLYLQDSKVAEDINEKTKEEMLMNMDEMAEELTKDGMPAQLVFELIYNYPITFRENDFMLTCQQGLNTKTSEYVYIEGVVPESADEISITPQIAEMLGAKIGDVITIHFGEQDVDCMVTAYHQTMNQMGEIIRLHEDAPTDSKFVVGSLHYQINFLDDPDAAEIELRKERVKELFDNDKVMNAAEFCMDSTQVADTMESVQFLLLGITLVVVILVTILMERSFIADEKSQIAILKAIGFKDSAILKWHVYRLGLVALVAVILAAVCSIPMTNLCIDPIFGMMGAVDVEYNIDPLQIFLLYPGAVLAMTVLVAWLTALYTKTIKSSDTANIE